ncbi:MAG TPA: hypothetical protein VGD52_21200 [Pseudoduganella sp.]
MNSKMTKRLTVLALLAAALAIPNAGAQTPIKKAERDELSFVPSDDPAMGRFRQGTLDPGQFPSAGIRTSTRNAGLCHEGCGI